MLSAAICAALMWLGLLLAPWRPWSTRERLAPLKGVDAPDFPAITVLIPARDEAQCIATTLEAVVAQGRTASIIVVDDQSSDGTADIANQFRDQGVQVISGTQPPSGWSGKLWALQQAYERADSDYLLLLDADIELAPGTLAALWKRLQSERLAFVSVMARLHMSTVWEKLLLPPFIYFFKLIYPFSLSNNPRSSIAAGAGGLILIEKSRLDSIGGFAALHDAIIDDCTLARLIKRAGGRTWIGLSQAVVAVRPYSSLSNIWNMVARTAFTQLRYSKLALFACTALLGLSFVAPIIGLFSGDITVVTVCLVALCAMALTYWPSIRFYELPAAWVASLPFAAVLFLAMTWTSALRYWSGERSRWKNRSYERAA